MSTSSFAISSGQPGPSTPSISQQTDDLKSRLDSVGYVVEERGTYLRRGAQRWTALNQPS